MDSKHQGFEGVAKALLNLLLLILLVRSLLLHPHYHNNGVGHGLVGHGRNSLHQELDGLFVSGHDHDVLDLVAKLRIQLLPVGCVEAANHLPHIAPVEQEGEEVVECDEGADDDGHLLGRLAVDEGGPEWVGGTDDDEDPEQVPAKDDVGVFSVVVVGEDLPAVKVGVFGFYHESLARTSASVGHGAAAIFLLAGIFCYADALGESVGAVSEADGEAVGFERGSGAVCVDG